MFDEEVVIISNERVAPSLHVVEFSAPQIASCAEPGQFVHLQIPDFGGHVLRRPFSIYTWDAEKGTLSILYQTVGSGSERLAETAPGVRTKAIGPVGHGWNPPAGTRETVLVCGGVGVAPLTMLAKQLVEAGAHVTCLVGATAAERVVGVEKLRELGADVRVATDDGTVGHHGFCTDLLAECPSATDYVAICGPAPMEKVAVARVAELWGDACTCEVSVERRMACGIGACLSCVVETVDGRKRACVDGPVFGASEVVW
ncbi:MAG: dihydroorotate dehydrogenase electron transfer subunit [Coriobacteriales bacterium]|jgi:dihydroorotate dehydrogenase electron transfer subunit